MLDITKVRHRSPTNHSTVKRSYILNYADCETAFDVLDGDVCLWGLLQYYLYRYEVYGETPQIDTNNPDEIKVFTLFGMIAPKLDNSAEEWKATCVRNARNRAGGKDKGGEP